MRLMKISPTDKIMRPAIAGTLALLLAACAQGMASEATASAASAPAEDSNALRVRITAGASIMVAQLDNTATARSFSALLPLQLPLADHASTEKVATLPQKLSVEGAPVGADADVYDIAYYAPLGNFVIYYRDPPYFPGLVRLGRIQTGGETLTSASGTVTIEAID